MPISDYLRGLREHVGQALILIPAAVAVIPDDAGRILLVQRSDSGRWDLPAGVADPGEPPAACLAREVWEETGLQVAPVRILGVFGGEFCRLTYPNGDRLEPTVTVFLCRVVGGALQARDGEALGFRYVAPAELPPLGHAYPPEIFSDLAEARPPAFQWDAAWLDALR